MSPHAMTMSINQRNSLVIQNACFIDIKLIENENMWVVYYSVNSNVLFVFGSEVISIVSFIYRSIAESQRWKQTETADNGLELQAELNNHENSKMLHLHCLYLTSHSELLFHCSALPLNLKKDNSFTI